MAWSSSSTQVPPRHGSQRGRVVLPHGEGGWSGRPDSNRQPTAWKAVYDLSFFTLPYLQFPLLISIIGTISPFQPCPSFSCVLDTVRNLIRNPLLTNVANFATLFPLWQCIWKSVIIYPRPTWTIREDSTARRCLAIAPWGRILSTRYGKTNLHSRQHRRPRPRHRPPHRSPQRQARILHPLVREAPERALLYS